MRTTILHRDRIHPDPANVRTVFNDIPELAATIRAVGLLQPLVVRPYPGNPGHYVIIMGERRYRACKVARLDQIPCIIRQVRLTRAAVVQMMLIENDSRDSLKPMERARAYAELRSSGMSVDLIAKGLGYTPQTIYTYLDLVDLLDETTQKRIENDEIRWQDARAAAREMKSRRQQYTSPAGIQRRKKRVSFEPDALTSSHPLAELARSRCRQAEHHLTRAMVRAGHVTRSTGSQVACGQCWESVIREDERSKVLAEIQQNITPESLLHLAGHEVQITATTGATEIIPPQRTAARFGDKPRRTISEGDSRDTLLSVVR